MEELNKMKVELRLVDENGEEVAKVDIPYAEIGGFRKANGAPPSVLIQNMIDNLVNIAMYGPNGLSKGEPLPPRKPGGLDFNR